MAAMESSTKNATEMLGKLTLSYNRSASSSASQSSLVDDTDKTVNTCMCIATFVTQACASVVLGCT